MRDKNFVFWPPYRTYLPKANRPFSLVVSPFSVPMFRHGNPKGQVLFSWVQSGQEIEKGPFKRGVKRGSRAGCVKWDIL